MSRGNLNLQHEVLNNITCGVIAFFVGPIAYFKMTLLLKSGGLCLYGKISTDHQ